jgi:pilus assembly protein CpaB
MAAITQSRPAPTSIRTPLFILGVALALLAFLAMFAFGILFANRSSLGGQVRLVVAARDINAREPITPDAVVMTTIPSTAQPPQAFLHIADLSGLSALIAIPKGQVITANMVSNQGSPFLEIPKGYVATTIPTSEQQGVGGYVAQGDELDVIASVNTGLFSQSPARTVVKTVFTSLYVLRIGPQSAAPRQGQAPGVVSSVTVLMTECDAQLMDWLVLNASLKYTLLSYHDYSTIPPADPTCPSTTPPAPIGPAQVDKKWGFTTS